MNTEAILFTVIVILIAAGIIAVAEFLDKQESTRYRQIMREGIMVTGKVTKVERKGPLDPKSSLVWRTTVSFEYMERSYTLEQCSVSRSVLNEGDFVTVYVYRKDPWKSRFVV